MYMSIQVLCSYFRYQSSFVKRTEKWEISEPNFEIFFHTGVGLGRVWGCQHRHHKFEETMSKFSLKVMKISFRGNDL